MKRDGPLKTDPAKVEAWRRRSKPMERKPTAPKPRKPLPLRSANRAAFDRAFEAAKVVVRKRSGGRCEARFDGCTGMGEHFHHRRGRVGKEANSPAMVLHACRHCHEFGHANPALSYQTGFMVRRVA